ncbi:MAG: phenylalanine--tRNA ligase subunit alpha [Bdellovibrionales bacterium RIFOXYB1_FULL_37_110]|nr:MAG: phenylalanine--tRNA ligase subunit alpha [Bdellovibrionales bacterium RIFOXYA1_FULL_38_20]OFZ48628.1 MAG: phenylalanine--tRNA ligase subunit alpha [Bdellovibrionales bacterium RIFOXYC1_FULL_37_79]OFZ58436.1 MAG: phenylalanine--tRNA ligase subunit alpha [Bdellovibrionales bacterium RIFOXYB1_FULL_37_110]OFZ62529.1 MAG: phenylalanine--tRNA ligase subunit alpha [Bdellovibrionales bacterium RIFOXYD1_FULL_36_51]
MKMSHKLDQLLDELKKDLSGVTQKEKVLDIKSKYLGKKGPIADIMSGLKNASLEEKKEIGSKVNIVKDQIQDLITHKLSEIESSEINETLKTSQIDITYRDYVKQTDTMHAGFHPLSAIKREIEDIFVSMGFEVLDGPHIEEEFYNFDALNIPPSHPARDMQDTFWFHDKDSTEEKKRLLRTHTSCVQVRGMLKRKPPFRFIVPGKVFRAEKIDASHEAVFHQVEGMLVDKNISVANLIYFMKVALREIFKKDVEVRLRPGFFPFVEPGFELDVKCLICGGKGCSVCKQSGWLELLPCGMIHPNVLKAGKIDPEIWNGFAFGMGLDRLVMMRFGIDDIRNIHGADLRFINQFKSY